MYESMKNVDFKLHLIEINSFGKNDSISYL